MANDQIDREAVKIFIAAADTDGSNLASSDQIKGEITNHGMTGGNRTRDSEPAFGGFIVTRSPRGDFVLSMDVTPKLTGTAATDDRWDIFKYGTTGASTGEEVGYAIFISRLKNGAWKTSAFNNAFVSNWEPSHNAAENEKGTVEFTIAPETDLGVANIKTSALAYSTGFFTWA